MADWSILPGDLVTYIAKRIVCMEDLIAFGGVCKSWNSVATKENFIGRLTHQFPLNMLPNKVDTITPEFSNNKKGRFHKLNPPESKKRQRYYPSMGWLMSVSEVFELQSLCPSRTSNYTVGVTCELGKVLWRPGEDEWTIADTDVLDQFFDHLDSLRNSSHILDLTYFNGRFYSVEDCGTIVACDVEDFEEPKMKNVGSIWKLMREHDNLIVNLLESAGTLLVVFRYEGSRSESLIEYSAFKVPFNGDCSGKLPDLQVKNLGNSTMLLGSESSSFSIHLLDSLYGVTTLVI